MSKEIEYIKSRSQTIAKYSDKLRQSIKDIDCEMTPIFADAGISVSDDEFKYEDGWGNTYQLSILKATYGKYAGQWGIYLEDGQDVIWVGDASRAALKMVVMRIIPLLEKYSKVLEQKELEYESIANMAGKMAESVKDNHHV